MWLDRDGERGVRCTRKLSPAVAQKHGQMLCLMVRKSKIKATVAVEIADRNIIGIMPCGKR